MPLTARFGSGAIHRANLKPLSRLNTRNKLRGYRVVQSFESIAERTIDRGARSVQVINALFDYWRADKTGRKK